LSATPTNEPDWLHGHAHEPNPAPPTLATAFSLLRPLAPPQMLDVADLHRLPATTVPDCYIVSTGHGRSGPFRFTGVRLADLFAALLGVEYAWQHADVVSADGFGTRIFPSELAEERTRPILMAYALDGAPLSRAQGLVRLIVPSETDDALRQVKWVAEIRIK
jgi:DMSO/TMAO reductase YedYZ molybdopterin-dependent catalytic subunit